MILKDHNVNSEFMLRELMTRQHKGTDVAFTPPFVEHQSAKLGPA